MNMATSALTSTASLSLNSVNTAPVSIQPEFLLTLRRNSKSVQVPAPAGAAPDAHLALSPQTSALAYSPAAGVRRHALSIPGLTVEIVQSATDERIESRIRNSGHTLIAYERGSRRDGLTVVDGLPPSSVKDMTRKFTFLPAGQELREWHKPGTALTAIYFHFDRQMLGDENTGEAKAASVLPRLFFEDGALWDTVMKIKAAVEAPGTGDQRYLEALGLVLAHEVTRPSTRPAAVKQQIVRGGLAPWQQRAAIAYIDSHLSEAISLATLAGLVRLSPYYFCRAFKQSMGMPPHRYHTQRRIELAKELLSKRDQSVTDIGLTVGFRETSSFSSAFRKATGLTPSSYQRNAA